MSFIIQLLNWQSVWETVELLMQLLSIYQLLLNKHCLLFIQLLCVYGSTPFWVPASALSLWYVVFMIWDVLSLPAKWRTSRLFPCCALVLSGYWSLKHRIWNLFYITHLNLSLTAFAPLYTAQAQAFLLSFIFLPCLEGRKLPCCSRWSPFPSV